MSHECFYGTSTLDIGHLKQYFFQRCKFVLNNALQFCQQQDCYEFYNYFCSLLSRTTGLLHENGFTQLYLFLLGQEIRCLSCSNVSATTTNTFSLEVTLRESDLVTTLSTQVKNFFQEQLVERQIPHCRSNGASLTQSMASSPAYLVVCIKRFSWNSVTQTAKMVDQPVILSPIIQLSRSHDLVGIIHYEGSLKNFHYCADKKTNFGLVEINDSPVSVATSMTRSTSAYKVSLPTTSGSFEQRFGAKRCPSFR